MALAQDDRAEQRRGFWTAGLGVYALWNLFTLVGALAGQHLGDPKAWGLDGAAGGRVPGVAVAPAAERATRSPSPLRRRSPRS